MEVEPQVLEGQLLARQELLRGRVKSRQVKEGDRSAGW